MFKIFRQTKTTNTAAREACQQIQADHDRYVEERAERLARFMSEEERTAAFDLEAERWEREQGI